MCVALAEHFAPLANERAVPSGELRRKKKLIVPPGQKEDDAERKRREKDIQLYGQRGDRRRARDHVDHIVATAREKS